MQVLVLYYSKSGHTRQLADAIAQGVQEIKEVSCVMKSTTEVTRDDFLRSHAIIAGSPVYFGTMAAELKAIFDDYVNIRKQMEDKIGAAFATSADESGGKETTITSILHAMLIYGMILVGDPLDATGHYGIACTGAPNSKTKKNAIKMGRRVALLVKKLHS